VTEFTRLTYAPTKDEHDAVVARKGRPFTDTGMREARRIDNDATDSGLSLIERVAADARHHAKKAGTP